MIKHGMFRALTPQLATLFKAVPDHGKVWIIEAHDHYEGELRRLRDDGLSPESIAYSLHDLGDEAITKFKQAKQQRPYVKRIACKAGCSHCCYSRVDVTIEEAVLLAELVEHEGLELDNERLSAQVAAREDWDRLPHDRAACVFLDGSTGRCRVYEHRPLVCRKYFALDNSDQCDTVKHPAGKVLNWTVPYAEVIQSAMFEVCDWGPLPAMLMKAKARKGDPPS
jgi:Fe-S-cluster containining protein